MRFSLSCMVVVLFSTVAAAGDYGTLTGFALGQAAGNSMGSGGRFDWNPAVLSTNSNWNSAWSLQLTGGGTLYTFCIELAEHMNSAVFDVNALTNAPNNPASMTAAKALDVEKLADAYFASATIGGSLAAGAFQYALWEIIHGDQNVSTAINGSFWGISAAARTMAGGYLAGLGSLSDLPGTTALALVKSGRQDQLIQVSVAVVPELSSIVVWGIFTGLLACVWHRWRPAIG